MADLTHRTALPSVDLAFRLLTLKAFLAGTLGVILVVHVKEDLPGLLLQDGPTTGTLLVVLDRVLQPLGWKHRHRL